MMALFGLVILAAVVLFREELRFLFGLALVGGVVWVGWHSLTTGQWKAAFPLLFLVGGVAAGALLDQFRKTRTGR
jgi:hypothetical protein